MPGFTCQSGCMDASVAIANMHSKAKAPALLRGKATPGTQWCHPVVWGAPKTLEGCQDPCGSRRRYMVHLRARLDSKALGESDSESESESKSESESESETESESESESESECEFESESESKSEFESES